jgi:hypothetical protein
MVGKEVKMGVSKLVDDVTVPLQTKAALRLRIDFLPYQGPI